MPLELVHSAIARALGWALIHFLWEGAAVAALVAAVLYLGRPVSAKVRYGAACVALAAMLAAFGVTLAILWPAPPVTIAIQPALRFAATIASLPASQPPPPAPADRLNWIVPFWMAGVLIFYARTAGGWLAAQRLRGKAAAPAAPEWQERLRVLAARLRVTRPVVLLESCLAESPVMMGLLRPVILVPAGLLAGLAPDQLEAILLHELAHIRRHDYAVNVLQSLVEGLLFYHPAVWWVSGIVRAERENCCDDAVVAVRGDARGYAAALAALESLRSAGHPALAARGGNLMKRIHRLLEPERPRSAAAPVLAAILLITPMAWALAGWQPAPAASSKSSLVLSTAPIGAATVTERGVSGAATVRSLSFAAPLQALLLARGAPQDQSAEARLRAELMTPYGKWLNEDVAYIITDEERQAFLRMQTNAEREQFIEQFWLRRDPTPGTIQNEFKEEHYRRIAYANAHFAAGIPGWKTDRGRIYIVYGPPDEIDDHSGAVAPATPYQRWRYRLIQRIGENVTIEFTDPARSGEYYMTPDSNGRATLFQRLPGQFTSAPQPPAVRLGDREREIAILSGAYQAAYPPPAARGGAPILGMNIQVAQGHLPNDSLRMLTVGFSTDLSHPFSVFGQVYEKPGGKRALVFEEAAYDQTKSGFFHREFPLAPGSYQIIVSAKDLTTNQVLQHQSDIEILDVRGDALDDAIQQQQMQLSALTEAYGGAVPVVKEAEAQLKALESERQKAEAVGGAQQAVKNQKLVNLDSAIRQQQLILAALKERYQDSWPPVKEAQAQLKVLEAERQAQAAKDKSEDLSAQAQAEYKDFILFYPEQAAQLAPPANRPQARASTPGRPSPPDVSIEVAPGTLPNDSNRAVTIYVPVKTAGAFSIYGRITTASQRRVTVFEDGVTDVSTGIYRKVITLLPGSYTLDVVLKDIATGQTSSVKREFKVADAMAVDRIKRIRASIADLEKKLADTRAEIEKTERTLPTLSPEAKTSAQARLASLRQALQVFEDNPALLRTNLRQAEQACVAEGPGICEVK